MPRYRAIRREGGFSGWCKGGANQAKQLPPPPPPLPSSFSSAYRLIGSLSLPSPFLLPPAAHQMNGAGAEGWRKEEEEEEAPKPPSIATLFVLPSIPKWCIIFSLLIPWCRIGMRTNVCGGGERQEPECPRGRPPHVTNGPISASASSFLCRIILAPPPVPFPSPCSVAWPRSCPSPSSLLFPLSFQYSFSFPRALLCALVREAGHMG